MQAEIVGLRASMDTALQNAVQELANMLNAPSEKPSILHTYELSAQPISFRHVQHEIFMPIYNQAAHHMPVNSKPLVYILPEVKKYMDQLLDAKKSVCALWGNYNTEHLAAHRND